MEKQFVHETHEKEGLLISCLCELSPFGEMPAYSTLCISWIKICRVDKAQRAYPPSSLVDTAFGLYPPYLLARE
jgi:hypothetical protein